MLISREEEMINAAHAAGVQTRKNRRRSSTGSSPDSPPRYDPSKFGKSPPVSLSDFKSKQAGILAEFFSSGDVSDVRQSLIELHCPVFHYAFVKKIITLSMDKTDREREMVCRLISDLYGSQTLSSNQVGKAFERLFEQADDLELDSPDFRHNLCNFLARTVADEVLPPCFLKDPIVCSLGGEMIEHTKVLLTRKHGIARLERVWGPGDGRSVAELKKSVKQLLHEYVLSSDVHEATRCVQELNSKFFHHEVVKDAIEIGMDGDANRRSQISTLFAFLHTQEVIDIAQIQKGFDRVMERLPDTILDVPNAVDLLSDFIQRAIKSGYLPPSFEKKFQEQKKNPKFQEM